MKKLFNNSSGFSLVQVVVAAGILMIIALGVATVFQSSNKVRDQGLDKTRLDEMRSAFVECAKNGKAWEKTVADGSNASLACIRNNTSCTGQAGAIRLRNSDGNLCMGYDSLSTDQGFDRSGALCQGFGNDQCPFRASFVWKPFGCADDCVGPQAQVNIKFEQAPTTGLPINTLLFDQVVVRGFEFTRNDVIIIKDIRTSGVPGGGCTANNWKLRDFTASKYKYDPANNVPRIVDNTGQMEFQAGSYICSIMAPAYKVEAHRVRLVNQTAANTPIMEGTNEYAYQVIGSSMTYSVAKGFFTLNSKSWLYVQHYCKVSNDNKDFGIALSIPGSQEVYTTIECIRRS